MTSNHSQLTQQNGDVDKHISWEMAQRGIRLLLEAVGEDPTRDGLTDTGQRRLTIQEQLTTDIASGIANELDAVTVFVEMNTTHLGEPTTIDREQFRSAVASAEDNE